MLLLERLLLLAYFLGIRCWAAVCISQVDVHEPGLLLNQTDLTQQSLRSSVVWCRMISFHFLVSVLHALTE